MNAIFVSKLLVLLCHFLTVQSYRLQDEKIKNRIQHKAYRNRPLTYWEKIFNKPISKTRYVVERTFGGMKRWFKAGIARYMGIEKMHTQPST